MPAARGGAAVRQRIERDPGEEKARTRFGAWLMRAQEIALCLVRKWHRPAIYIGIIGGLFVNVIWLPLVRREPIDLMNFAAVIGALAPIVAIREWGKHKGTVPGDDAPGDTEAEGEMA
jgi:hypothetical protein